MKLRLPVTTYDLPLTEANMVKLLDTLDGEDRAVARELFLNARFARMKSFRQLAETVDFMTPGERKTLTNRIRKRLGLKTSADLEFERASARARAEASARSEWQACPACGAIPVDPYTGAPKPVDVNRWWCEQHVDMASPGDMTPRSSGFMYSESGAIVPIPDPAELLREKVQQESRERQHQERLRQREYETEQQRREQKLRDEMFRRELPEQFR